MAKTRIIYQNTLNVTQLAKDLGVEYKKLTQVEKTRFQAEHAPILESKDRFRLDGFEVQVRLDLKNMSFDIFRRVKGEPEQLIVSGGKTKNHNILKTQAKAELVKLGFNFSDENRKRTRVQLELDEVLSSTQPHG